MTPFPHCLLCIIIWFIITRDMPEAGYVADPQKVILPAKPEMEMAGVKSTL